MKRIEAIIKTEKLVATVDALEKLGMPATIYEAKGLGKGEKYTIKYGLGTGSAKALYSDRKTIVIVVNDELVEQVVSAIKIATNNAAQGSGIIFISTVDVALAI